MNYNKFIQAWVTASTDLCIRIQAPFILKTENGKDISFLLLIKDFGGEKGTIVFSIDDMGKVNLPEEYGYYSSALNPLLYSDYNRETFIEMLNDCGYFGDILKKPLWLNS